MIWRYFILLFWLPMALTGQTKGELLNGFDSRYKSEHFVFQWNKDQTSQAEIDEAKTLAEDVYQQLTQLLGGENMPSQKLIITFRGEGLDRVSGKKRTPHVDFQGRTHLYRFAMGGYLSPLPHELVHAVRVGEIPDWRGFFEEGIASGIAYYLYPEKKGFPRFGYELDLVAGYWLTSGKGIPMSTMVDQHNRLNLKCQLQTYVTREDFFSFLIGQYGIKSLVDLSYSDKPGSHEGYLQHFGKPFEALVADWQADLTKRYQAIDQPELLVSNYFKQTSARYIPVCKAGTDY